MSGRCSSFQVNICTVKSSMWIYFHILLVIWTSCYNTSVSGDQVICSSQVVLAKVGVDVTLPCHIDPPVNMSRKTVQWSRPDLKPEYVHVLQDGHDIPLQNLLYKWRTSLFVEELPHGNISLRLSRVQLSDEGTFQCLVPYLDSSSVVMLIVGSVSQPVSSFIGQEDNGSLIYLCDSGCWYPEPDMSWLDSEGNLLSGESSVTVNHSQHCYTVQRNVTVTPAGHVTCRVHLPHINYTVEISIISPAARHHQGTNSRITSSGGIIAGAIVGIVFGIVLVALMTHFCWKKPKQNEYSIKVKGEEVVFLDMNGSEIVDLNPSTQTLVPSGYLAGGVAPQEQDEPSEQTTMASPTEEYLIIPVHRSSSREEATPLNRSKSLSFKKANSKPAVQARRCKSVPGPRPSGPLTSSSISLTRAGSFTMKGEGPKLRITASAIPQDDGRLRDIKEDQDGLGEGGELLMTERAQDGQSLRKS